ncbi:MAG TPA: glycosyltransferase family 4 protein [Chloroflexota bacterium]|nr:glycosyltransferase family 4 protein [Chloroflexota bacterium]
MSTSDSGSFKILHLVTSLDLGGAQNHLLSLVKGLRARGHTADVAFFKNPTLLKEFQATGAEVFDLSTRRTFSPLLIPRLTGILRDGRYQILHTHLLKADSYGAVAGMLARTPVVLSSKHNDEIALQNPRVATVHGLLSRLDRKVIVLSDYVGRYVSSVGKVDRTRIDRVYYGIQPTTAATAEDGARVRAELGIPAEAPLIATVGRLMEQKGLVYLLQAMKILGDRLPEARLLVVGDSQDGRDGYKMELLKQWESMGLQGKVVFTGVRHDIPAVVQAIDLFAMASLWEGFGLVFLEAMAAARPIVATEVSAVPEVVENGVTGLLVPPRDPQALADAMYRLLTERDRATAMGEAGLLKLKQQFSEDKMVQAIEQIYSQLWRCH